MLALVPLALALSLGQDISGYVEGGVALNPWTANLSPDALATYLDSEGLSILVAAAGDHPAQTRQLREALVGALRRSGRVRAVTGDSRLGNLAGLSDAQVVERARAVPADVILVARLFPGAAGQPRTAVVTFYEARTGATSAALTVTEGSQLAPRVGGQALPSSAAESVQQVVRQHQGGVEPPRGPPPSPGSPEAAYQAQAIWRGTSLVVNSYNGAYLGSSNHYYRGNALLELADVYAAVGRPDLVTAYHRRGVTRGILVGTGIAAMVAGASVAIAGAFVQGSCTTINSVSGACVGHQQSDATVALVGGGIALAGIVATLWGASIDHEPVTQAETDRLVLDYDRALHDKLVPPGTQAPPPASVGLRIAPFVAPGGGGLGAGLSF